MIKISRCQRFTRYLLAATLLLGTTALPALAEPRGTHWLNVGDTIEVDKLQASTPAGAMWTTGTILEVNQKMNSYLVDVEGVKMTIINNDKWIKPAAGGQQGANRPQAAQQNIAAGQQGLAQGFIQPNRPAGGSKFNIGDFVSVDKIMASTTGAAMWSSAQVISINKAMNSITVLTPDGVKRTIVNSPNWIKPGGTPFTHNQAAADQPPAQAKTQQPRQAAGGAEWDKRKGLGAPPSGRYVVNKAGYGYGLDIGELIIQGNTYQGIVRGGGASAPYTLDGDKIVWTNGLEGLPHNAPLVTSKYIGADEHGRALIRIWYRGNRGALEVLDAYRVGQ